MEVGKKGVAGQQSPGMAWNDIASMLEKANEKHAMKKSIGIIYTQYAYLKTNVALSPEMIKVCDGIKAQLESIQESGGKFLFYSVLSQHIENIRTNVAGGVPNQGFWARYESILKSDDAFVSGNKEVGKKQYRITKTEGKGNEPGKKQPKNQKDIVNKNDEKITISPNKDISKMNKSTYWVNPCLMPSRINFMKEDFDGLVEKVWKANSTVFYPKHYDEKISLLDIYHSTVPFDSDSNWKTVREEAWKLYGAYLDVLTDPLNPQNTENLRQAAKKFVSAAGVMGNKEKKTYVAVEQWFTQKFGIPPLSLEKFATKIDDMRMEMTILENTAPFIDLDKVNAAKTENDLGSEKDRNSNYMYFIARRRLTADKSYLFSSETGKTKFAESLGKYNDKNKTTIDIELSDKDLSTLQTKDASVIKQAGGNSYIITNTGEKLNIYELDTYGNVPISNSNIYNFLSNAYLHNNSTISGNEVSSGKLPAYARLDLISANEAILSSETFNGMKKTAFKRGFTSQILLGMPLRTQYDLFVTTMPKLQEQDGLWDDQGLTINGLALLENTVAKIDSTRAPNTPKFQDTIGQSGTIQNNDITSLISLLKDGETAIIKIKNKNGTISEINGIVSILGDIISVGTLKINKSKSPPTATIPGIGPNGTDGVLGTDFSITDYMIPTTPVSITQNVQLNPSNVMLTPANPYALPNASLDGFFHFAMPTLLSKYQLYLIDPMTDGIKATMDMISSEWTAQPSGIYTSDITGLHSALYDFNKKLPELLLTNNVRDIAIYKVKSSSKLSDFGTLQQNERLFTELMQSNMNNFINFIPYANISFTGRNIRNLKPPIGWTIDPTQASQVRAVFSDTGLEVMGSPPRGPVRILKYDYNSSILAGKAITDAASGFGPKQNPHRKFEWANLELVSSGQYSKLPDYDHTYTGLAANWKGGLTFYGAQTSHDFTDGNYAGSFRVDVQNSKIPGSKSILQTGRVVSNFYQNLGKPFALPYLESYFLTRTPENNNGALYIVKNPDNTFSVRIAGRGANNEFRHLFTIENLEAKQVAVMLGYFESNKGVVKPLVALKGNQGMEKSLLDQDFAGLMIATNLGPKIGVALLGDIASMKNLSDRVRDALVADSDPRLAPRYDPSTGLTISNTAWKSYIERWGFSSFFDISEKCGLYAQVIASKYSTAVQPSEYAVTFVVDDKWSVAASLDRRPGRTDFTDYSFDGKVRLGDTATGQFTSATSYLPYSFNMLAANQNYGASRLVMNLDKYRDKVDTDKSVFLRRYMLANLLYNAPDDFGLKDVADPINRTIAGRYDDLLGWVNTSLKAIEQKGDNAWKTNGFGLGFNDDSKRVLPFKYNTGFTGTYTDPNYRLGTFSVKEIIFKNAMGKQVGRMTAGALLGTYNNITGLGTAGQATNKGLIGGAGMRMSVGNWLTVLQAVTLPGGSAGAVGIGYDASNPYGNTLKNENKRLKQKGFYNYNLVSWRSEKIGSPASSAPPNSSLNSFNGINFNSVTGMNRGGLYAYFDKQKMTIELFSSTTLDRVADVTQSGAGLFYFTPDGKWRVSGGLSQFTQNEITTKESAASIDLGLDFYRQPGSSRFLSHSEFKFGYNFYKKGTPGFSIPQNQNFFLTFRMFWD